LQDPQVPQWLDGVEPTWTLAHHRQFPGHASATQLIGCFARELVDRALMTLIVRALALLEGFAA
jgi:hypothetical protein